MDFGAACLAGVLGTSGWEYGGVLRALNVFSAIIQ